MGWVQTSSKLHSNKYIAALWAAKSLDGTFYIISGIRSPEKTFFGGLLFRPPGRQVFKGLIVMEPEIFDEAEFIEKMSLMVKDGAFPTLDGKMAGPDGLEKHVMIEVHSSDDARIGTAVKQLHAMGYDDLIEAFENQT